MIIRPATLSDFEAFYGRKPPISLRALAAVRDNTIVGIGGYYIQNGLAVAFTDSISMTKREVIQAGRAFMAFIRGLKIDVVAQCNPASGDTVLKHYGFKPYRDDAWRLEI